MGDVSLFTGTMAVKNVQRGRDNGPPSYNDAREWFNLSRAESFADLLAGGEGEQGLEDIANALRRLYGDDSGGVANVDSYVGALLESLTLRRWSWAHC